MRDITSRATGVDEQGYECCEWRDQNQRADDNCPAPGKTTFSLEAAATQEAQYVDANTMSYQIENEVHLTLTPPSRVPRYLRTIFQAVYSSVGRHQHCKRHLDELFVLVDRPERAAHILGDVCRSALFDPVRQLHDGGFEGELVFVDFEEKGREQVGFGYFWFPWQPRSQRSTVLHEECLNDWQDAGEGKTRSSYGTRPQKLWNAFG